MSKVGTVLPAKKVECGKCSKVFLMGIYSMLEAWHQLKWLCPECKKDLISLRDELNGMDMGAN